jgi:two-component system sensor histidine kinase VicK
MGAVRKVENYPLIINLMVDEEVYLADWRKNASVITVIAVGSIGVVILSFSLLAAMLRRREDNLKVTTELKQRAELANQQQAVLLDNLTRQQLVLKEISDRLEATFQNAADGIIMSDENGDIEAFNPAAEIIYGYTQAEVLHKHSKIFTPPGAENIWTIVSQSEEFRTTGKIHLEAERMRKDGSLFIAEMAVSEYALSDKRKLIIIVRDITARRKMEKLKNEFISTVSHELRTPLTAIRGALGLVVGGATGELPDKCMSMIRIAHQNSEGLTRLINDLLDIQRLEIGKMTYVFEVFAVQDLLATAVQSNVTVATNLGVKLALIGAPSKEKILVDAGRFQQVMANLISNACKYAPKESSVTIQTQHEIPGIVRIEVSDEGVGIPEDFQERIFQKFSQADSSDTRAKGGTGLGLSITQALVKQMHGEIGYFTTPGYGTTFYVDFPVSK